MPEIALIYISDTYCDSYDCCSNHAVISSITNWEVVSEEDLKILKSYKDRNYVVIERITGDRFSTKLSDALAAARKDQERRERDSKARKAAELKRQQQKEAKAKLVKEEKEILELIKNPEIKKLILEKKNV